MQPTPGMKIKALKELNYKIDALPCSLSLIPWDHFSSHQTGQDTYTHLYNIYTHLMCMYVYKIGA